MALVNAQGNPVAITLEPTYSGKGDKNCTAEQFLQAVEAQKSTAHLTDADTIAYARKFLRGYADAFFKDLLPGADPTRAESAGNSWTVWKTIFKENFYSISAANHVSTGWARLKQLQSENVFDFACRVSTHIKAYIEFLPGPKAELLPTPLPLSDNLVTTFRDYINTCHTDNAIPTAADLKTWMQAELRTLGTELIALGYDGCNTTHFQTLILKVVVSGLHDNGARDLANRMEAEGKSLMTVVHAIMDKERQRAQPAPTNAPLRSRPRPEISISDVHQSEIAAVGGRANGAGRGRGRQGRGGGGTRAFRTNPPQMTGQFNTDDYDRGAVCGYCHYNNHRTDQCRRKKAGIPPPARAAAVDAHNSNDAEMFLPTTYQGNGDSA
jgi:hypothetical protein